MFEDNNWPEALLLPFKRHGPPPNPAAVAPSIRFPVSAARVAEPFVGVQSPQPKSFSRGRD